MSTPPHADAEDAGLIDLATAAPEDRVLLILDDDMAFRQRLARAMERRGFDVTAAGSLAEARDCLQTLRPAIAVLDMRLDDGSGLDLVPLIREARADARIVMLTG